MHNVGLDIDWNFKQSKRREWKLANFWLSKAAKKPIQFKDKILSPVYIDCNTLHC